MNLFTDDFRLPRSVFTKDENLISLLEYLPNHLLSQTTTNDFLLSCSIEEKFQGPIHLAEKSLVDFYTLNSSTDIVQQTFQKILILASRQKYNLAQQVIASVKSLDFSLLENLIFIQEHDAFQAKMSHVKLALADLKLWSKCHTSEKVDRLPYVSLNSSDIFFHHFNTYLTFMKHLEGFFNLLKFVEREEFLSRRLATDVNCCDQSKLVCLENFLKTSNEKSLENREFFSLKRRKLGLEAWRF